MANSSSKNNEMILSGVTREQYKFSVIMALYNVADYMREAVESIINQTLGFEENIQLILVNDGSLDNTEKLCLEYQAKYPENIEYFYKENGGVSSARNYGINNIKGRYTIFLDGDDVWDENAFDEIYVFFEHYRKKTDVCFCRIEYIGDFIDRKHPLDFKYKRGNRLVDLINKDKNINSSIGNTVFKSEIIAERRFNEDLCYGEDALFINEILLDNAVCGLISTAVFYYRRNYSPNSATGQARESYDWFFNVVEPFYFRLFSESIKKYGNIVRFIQRIVMYDLQWRIGYFQFLDSCTPQQRQEYLKLIKSTIYRLEDNIILGASNINQYKRLYLIDMKYGDIWKRELKIKKAKVLFNGKKILSFNLRSFFCIKTIDIKDDRLILEGIVRNHILGHCIDVFALNSSMQRYDLAIDKYDNAAVKGVLGENIVVGTKFKLSIPIKEKTRIKFFAEFSGMKTKIIPSFEAELGIDNKSQNSYKTEGAYIIKFLDGQLAIYKKRFLTLVMSEFRNIRENLQKGDKKWLKERIQTLRLEYIASHLKIKKRVAFVSFRSNGSFIGNMKEISEYMNVPSVCFVGMMPHTEGQKRKACKAIFGSKVVVVDDYIYYLRKYGKRPGQKIIQLWHACGAFKRFGTDGGNLFPAIDALYHKDYDVVTVSSESIRHIYADAFCIDVNKVAALGCARTDIFYNLQFHNEIMKNVLDTHPELKNKKILLYAPTFRDIPGKGRKAFKPAFDMDKLSQQLHEEQIFVICPHPVMTEPIVTKNYDNILEIRDFSTNDMMFLADLLITDYSSVIFEFCLLEKPIVFFCPDLDIYNRDFYLNYKSDLPGFILKTEDELYNYLQKGDFSLNENYERFIEKYMGACDGKSCERIAELIKEQLEA